MKNCYIKACAREVWAVGMCPLHYRRFKRHGDPYFVNPKCNRDGLYKDRHKVYQKDWRKKNWTYYRSYLNARKRRIILATPKWQSIKELVTFYQECPVGYHVDHIIPLNGKNVCGLHTIINLQYLPAVENLKKSNKIY